MAEIKSLILSSHKLEKRNKGRGRRRRRIGTGIRTRMSQDALQRESIQSGQKKGSALLLLESHNLFLPQLLVTHSL